MERMLIVNEISLNRFITYTNSVYDIGKKIKGLSRKNCKVLIEKLNGTVKTTMFHFVLQLSQSSYIIYCDTLPCLKEE